MEQLKPFVYLSGEQFAELTQARKIAYLAVAVAAIIRDRPVVSEAKEPDPDPGPGTGLQSGA